MRVTKLGQPASRLDEHWDIPQHLECQLGKGPGWHAHPHGRDFRLPFWRLILSTVCVNCRNAALVLV